MILPVLFAPVVKLVYHASPVTEEIAGSNPVGRAI